MSKEILRSIVEENSPDLIRRWCRLFCDAYNLQQSLGYYPIATIFFDPFPHRHTEQVEIFSKNHLINYVFYETEMEKITISLQRFIKLKAFL
jgi:hypothetical protein